MGMSRNRNRVFIGRLNPEARSRDLERFFKDNGFSRLKDVNIKLGYAFVEFEDKRDAEDAVYELNKKEFFGSRITVEHATGTPKEDLPRGSERDRYRDRDFRDDQEGEIDRTILSGESLSRTFHQESVGRT